MNRPQYLLTCDQKDTCAYFERPMSLPKSSCFVDHLSIYFSFFQLFLGIKRVAQLGWRNRSNKLKWDIFVKWHVRYWLLGCWGLKFGHWVTLISLTLRRLVAASLPWDCLLFKSQVENVLISSQGAGKVFISLYKKCYNEKP